MNESYCFEGPVQFLKKNHYQLHKYYLFEDEEEEEDEEDLIDPATEIKEKCADDSCGKYKARLDECNERVRLK